MGIHGLKLSFFSGGAAEAAAKTVASLEVGAAPTTSATVGAIAAEVAWPVTFILGALWAPALWAKYHPEQVAAVERDSHDPAKALQLSIGRAPSLAAFRTMRDLSDERAKTNADRHQAELDAAWQRMQEMIEAFANQQRFNEDPFAYFMRLQAQALQAAMSAESAKAAVGAVKMSTGDTGPVSSTTQGANDEDDLRAQLAAILQRVPFLEFSNPADEALPQYSPYGAGNIPRILSGELHYARLENLYLHLCAVMQINHASVVENGAGANPDLATTLAHLGADVLIKDPGDAAARFVRHLQKQPELQRVQYATDVDASSPADIVFWTNPDDALVKPKEMSLGEYLGRDVKPGGFLVIQTDHNYEGDQRSFYLQPGLDPSEWETLYYGRMGPNLGAYENLLLPTIQGENPITHVQIYRRISKSAQPESEDAQLLHRHTQGLMQLIDGLGADSEEVKTFLRNEMGAESCSYQSILHQVLTRLAFEVNGGPLESWQIGIVKKMTDGLQQIDLLDGDVDTVLLREYFAEVFHIQKLCAQANRQFDFHFPNDWHFLVGQHPSINGILQQEIQNMQGFFRMFGDRAALLYSREGEFRAVLRDTNQNALSYTMVISRGYHEQRNGFQIALYDKGSLVIQSRYGGRTRTRCLAKVGVVFGEEGVLRIVNSQGLTQQQLGEITARQRMAYLNEDLKNTSAVDLLLATLIALAREKGMTRLEGVRDEAQLAKQQQFEASGREKGDNQFYNLLFRRFGFQPPANQESDYWSLDLVNLPIRRRKQPKDTAQDSRTVTQDSKNTLAEYLRQVLIRPTSARPDVWDRTRPEPVAEPVVVFWKIFFRALHRARLQPGVNAEDATLPLDSGGYLIP